MGQPLATCCNPNISQGFSDTILEPLPQPASSVTKKSVDIAQLIKKR